MACVGPDHVPPTGFSLSCQNVLFLNDDKRLERIYAVNVALTGTNGVSGAVTLECGGADSKLVFDPSMDAPTNRLEFTMGVEEGEWFLDTKTVYLSYAQIGEGRVNAAIVFTNGTSCATSTTFRVIEPFKMRTLFKMVVVVMVCMTMRVAAHTPVETNEVVRTLLQVISSSDDDNFYTNAIPALIGMTSNSTCSSSERERATPRRVET